MNIKSDEKVLIVDDNPANIEVLGGILSRHYHVMVATDGEQAVKIATSENAPSLILLDIMMPVMDGYEVCKVLKAHKSARKIPIIMVSAKSQEEDETLGFELGVEDYIKKPVNPSITLARVKTQLMLKMYRDGLEDKLKKSESNVQKQKMYFTKLFEHSPQAIACVHQNNSIIAVNPSFEKLFGYAEKEVVGREMVELIVPKENYVEHNGFYGSIARGNAHRIESVRCHKEGRLIPVSIFGYSVKVDTEFEGSFVIYEDISQRKEFEKQLRHQAFHDALTGLANRVLLMERVERALERKKRQGNFKFAVLMIDLDRFKAINDSLGHQVGDELLIQISKRVEDCVRGTDTVARLGGDEFAVLLEEVKDQNEVRLISQRIQDSIEKEVVIGDHDLYVSGSIGIVVNMDGYHNSEDIFRDVDLAMYAAKDDGKATYKFFDDHLYQKAIESANIEKELRHVLERNELELHYQPIISLKSNQLTGFEALVRWRHPLRGMVPPDKFIPMAEDTGLIVPIGQWVMEEACRQLKEWHLQLGSNQHLTVNVNMSVKQFLQADFVDKVKRCLDNLQLSPDCLKLELTESLLMEHSRSALSKIEKLKEMGVQFVIDDFGTGYSSLSYIHKFPVDVLKIDRSFVNNLELGHECTEIIKTIVTMSKNLGMTVVAEGIESEFQLDILKQLSCENAQGYLISKPLPKDEVVHMLNHHFAQAVAG